MLYGLDVSKPEWGFANKKGADQPAHLCSMISSFFICLLESIVSTLVTSKFPNYDILHSFRCSSNGSQVVISQLLCMLVPEDCADPDEMPYSVAFHLGLHCLSSTHLGVSSILSVK